MKHNQSGFSIIEVLISFGVLALVSIGFLNFTDNQNKIIKSIDASFEEIDFVGQVHLILSNPQACLQTLDGLPLSSTSNQGFKHIRGSSLASSSPVSWISYIYKSKNNNISPSGNVKLTSLEIKYPSTFNGEVEMVMKLERTNQMLAGIPYIIRTIPLTVMENPSIPGQIGTCFASGAKLANWPSMCTALGGIFDGKKCTGLFIPSYSSQVTPAEAHWERLEISGGRVEIKIDRL